MIVNSESESERLSQDMCLCVSEDVRDAACVCVCGRRDASRHSSRESTLRHGVTRTVREGWHVCRAPGAGSEAETENQR